MEIIDQNQQAVTTKDWFITILITAIPLVGFIMLFVWAFGESTHPSKANWAKATLLWYVVGIVFVGILFSFGVMGALIGMADQVG
jgi:hypothetical protein